MRPGKRARPSALVPLAALAIVCASATRGGAATLDTGELRPSKRSIDGDRAPWLRLIGTIGAGVGLRFNNPYRLATPLGRDAESVSRTAAYVDVGIGAAFGDPEGITHGPVLRWDHAAQGVGQDVLTPSYALGRRWLAWEAWGRIGVPIVLRPDANAGGEVAIGGAWFATQGFGAWTELVGDLFYGAATPDVRRPAYPVLSLQLGAIVEWERLP